MVKKNKKCKKHKLVFMYKKIYVGKPDSIWRSILWPTYKYLKPIQFCWECDKAFEIPLGAELAC